MSVFLKETALCVFLLAATVLANSSWAQTNIVSANAGSIRTGVGPTPESTSIRTSLIGKYYNQVDGITLPEIVRLALETNGEIKISRLEVEKAKARLTQEGLRPNPSLDVSQRSGRLAGTPGDSEFVAGVSVPLEVFGQRSRRIDRAKAEIVLKEAEFSAKRRALETRIFLDYADALAALRELSVLDELIALDLQTVEFVQIRVNEGESAPLELSLLQTEIERLRVRRQILDGGLQSAITKLKYYAGLAYDQPLRLREDLLTATFPTLPPTIETGFTVGLSNRPEIRIAKLEEQLAIAGLRLIQSEAKPHLSAFSRFSYSDSSIDLPTGPYTQNSNRSLTFGILVGLPVFDRNQGAKAEAEIAIRQAQERHSFAEQVIKNEIVFAFQQIESAKRALNSLETNVLPRSRENIETIRKVYEIGEIKITDLLIEQRKLLDASRDMTESYIKRYRAEADLFIALGLTFEN